MAEFLKSMKSNDKDDRRERMQRIRVGLTGLAVVLIIVAVGTSLMNRVSSQAGTQNISQSAQAKIDGDEPLAHLGVAPGGENLSQPAK
jgi:hypothetical protein